MPETLPGFLVAAGIIIFVISLFSGSIKVGNNALPRLHKKGRYTLMVLGPLLFILGMAIYSLGLPIHPLSPQKENKPIGTITFFQHKGYLGENVSIEMFEDSLNTWQPLPIRMNDITTSILIDMGVGYTVTVAVDNPLVEKDTGRTRPFKTSNNRPTRIDDLVLFGVNDSISAFKLERNSTLD